MKQLYKVFALLMAANTIAAQDFEPQYVDLGLPSGTLWATCNVGAQNAWETGDCFAWGETDTYYSNSFQTDEEWTDWNEGKTGYNWESYSLADEGDYYKIRKYTIPDGCQYSCYWYDYKDGFIFKGDNKTILEPIDDAATAQWGSVWRTPTKAQMLELISECYWKSVNSYNGHSISGYIIYKAKNVSDKGVVDAANAESQYDVSSDAHIFLPLAGAFMWNNEHAEIGFRGYYWSSSISDGKTQDACYMEVSSYSTPKLSVKTVRRCAGLPIRPVRTSVDLDLPSGTLWATRNIGAEKAWDYGDFFAWGETQSKSEYTLSNYKFDGDMLTKYNSADGKTILEPQDDAATAQWGQEWRMPANAEYTELLSECYWEWTESYAGQSNKGYIVYKAKNEDDKGVKVYKNGTKNENYSLSDKHIFLPAGGYYNPNLNEQNSFGEYWSSSLAGKNSTNALDLFFASNATDEIVLPGTEGWIRHGGANIRAVQAKTYKITINQPANGTIGLQETDIDIENYLREGTPLHFIATPDDNYELESWSGCSEDGSLVVNGEVTVTCTFRLKQATSVKNEVVTPDNKVIKVLENGTMYIIKDGVKYNMQGVKIIEN